MAQAQASVVREMQGMKQNASTLAQGVPAMANIQVRLTFRGSLRTCFKPRICRAAICSRILWPCLLLRSTAAETGWTAKAAPLPLLPRLKRGTPSLSRTSSFLYNHQSRYELKEGRNVVTICMYRSQYVCGSHVVPYHNAYGTHSMRLALCYVCRMLHGKT